MDRFGWDQRLGVALLIAPVLLSPSLLVGGAVSALLLGSSVTGGLALGAMVALGVGALVAAELGWRAVPVAWAGGLAAAVVLAVAVDASEELLVVTSLEPFVSGLQAAARLAVVTVMGSGFGAAVALALAVRLGWAPVARGAVVVALAAVPGGILASRAVPWPAGSAEAFVALLLGLGSGLPAAIALEVRLARRGRPAVS